MSSEKTNDPIPNDSIKIKQEKINQENIVQKINSKERCHNNINMYEEDIYYKYYLEKEKTKSLESYKYRVNNSPNPLNMYEEYTY